MTERRVPPIDTIGAVILGLAIAFWVSSGVAGFTTDSDAYLDVAQNFRTGRGLVQTVVDFWRPALPDPLGMWPPLYPVLVAIVAAFGVPLESSGLLVSGASFVLFAALFHRLAARLLVRPVAAAATGLALATLGVALCSAHAWSEATYLALVTGGLLATARLFDPGDPPAARLALFAGACFGAAALTRYAGMPLALLAAVALAFTARPRRLAVPYALGALVAPLAWIVRDCILFGRPFGPALPPSSAGFAERAEQLARALRWELVPTPFVGPLPLVLVVLALVAAGVVWAFARRGLSAAVAGMAFLSLAVVLVATATTAINAPGGRYLAPALPFVWLAALAGLAPALARSRLRSALGAALVAALLIGTARDLTVWGMARPARTIASLERRNDRLALRALVPRDSDAAVLSDAGHALRLASGRPAVQIPPAAYRPRDLAHEDLARWQSRGVTLAVVRAGEDAERVLRRLGARPDSARGRFVRLVLP